MVKLANSWVIMNPGGGPTPDKPDISVVDYDFDNRISKLHEPARGRYPGLP
jgi:hypothetical protein